MPPATAASTAPRRISCAADTIACAPEPQTRFTVIAGTDTGSPAWDGGLTRRVHLSAGLNDITHDGRPLRSKWYIDDSDGPLPFGLDIPWTIPVGRRRTG
jgi:hypothetical protein